MGSVSMRTGEGSVRYRRSSFSYPALINVLMLFSLFLTNLFAFYAFFTSSSSSSSSPIPHHSSSSNISLISDQVSLILREIDQSQKKLTQMEKELLGYENLDLSRPNVAEELSTFLRHHPLPLGRDSRTGITHMVASVAHSCSNSLHLLTQYMDYKAGGADCPDDWHLAEKLILSGCEPLPRRRCFARSFPKLGLSPFPTSLWKTVGDKTASWNGFSCKSFECLNGKKLGVDCVGCFDLANGIEKQRWVRARWKNDFVIDDVLALGSRIRIGFDFGSASPGSFAAWMAEKNVTVITSTLNVDAPFNEFVAARGLFPIYLSPAQRFPFYDGVFDLVRTSLSGLGNGALAEKVEFVMFDIDRILRVGGLLWLDNFHCIDGEKKRSVTRLIDSFGYKKLRWIVGEKKADDLGTGKPRVYLSAVLQKTVRG